MTALERLRAIAPDLSDEGDSTLDVFLQDASRELCVQTWGELFPQGVVYLAAHLAVQSGYGSSESRAGEVQSKKTGDVSVTYGQTSVFSSSTIAPEDAPYLATKYGRNFLRLKAKIPSAGMELLR